MEALLQDPVFKGLLWSIFAVFGIIVGWLLRAAFPEKKLAQTLERVEQERNTVARLYSQLKRHYEYREADAKKADLELENLRDQVLSLQNAQKQRQNQERQLQSNTQRAENNARLYQEKVQGLEEATRQLRRRNTELESEMQRLQAEIESWEQFGNEFNALRQRLLRFEPCNSIKNAKASANSSKLPASKWKTSSSNSCNPAAPPPNDNIMPPQPITKAARQVPNNTTT
jgi:chromosome segregation ATPase